MVNKKSTYQDVSVKFCVGRGLIGRFVRAFKADSGYIDEIQAKENEIGANITAIVAAAKKIHDREGSIKKMALVQDAVSKEFGFYP